MSSLSRELVFLILQFLDEEKFKETVHKLEQESGFFFNMKHFEDEVHNGNWEEVERYLSGFTKVDDNRYSMKLFFEIRKQKYLEALDKHDLSKAVDVLVKDLKVFSSFNEELFKEITQLLTLENFRDNEQLSKYGDTRSARAVMLVELKKLIEANPLFRDKLQFPNLKNSRLRTLINQSLNWQHQLCKTPKPNPDIKTLFVDHSCGQPNGASTPSQANNPLLGGAVPKPGGFPLAAHVPFQPMPVPVPTPLASWMSNPPAGTHPAVSGGPLLGSPPIPAGFKYPRTPPNPSIDFLSGDSDHVNRRTRPLGISDEASQASLPVNIQPLSFPGIAHSHTFSALDDFPKSVAWTFSQGSTPMSMDFHPAQQTLLLVGTNVGDIGLWEVGSRERLMQRNFKVWDLSKCSMSFQASVAKDAGVSINLYDFKSSSRVGYRTLEVPSSRIVIIEGIYALSEKLRPLLDLRVSVTGGVHFDLVKRVLRDIQRAGQEPEEIIHQISETVYPMYKAFIEPDLQTAHIKIINKFNPFSGFQNPTYILKSTRPVTVDQIKAVFSDDYKESTEETYDIYLLPPGEDPEACQSYLRMRNRDGKYNLMFEEWVTDSPFIISPRITFEVSVRLLGGLMALGYTIASILKRSSHVFSSDKVCVKTDWLEQLNRKYIQVQGKDRMYVKFIAKELGLDGSYIPRTYIEQIQLEKLINDVMALPDDLKTKLSIDDDLVSSPKEALSRASADRRMKFMNRGVSQSYTTNRDRNLSKLTKLAVNNRRYDGRTPDSPAALANQGIVTQLSEQISTLNERMDEFTSRIEELNSKVSIRKVSASQQNLALQADGCNAVAPSSLFGAGIGNGLMSGSHLPNSSSSSQLARESAFMEEVLLISRGQRQIMLQIDNLSSMLHEFYGERSHQGRTDGISDLGSIGVPLLLSLAVGGVGILLLKNISAKT